MKGSVIPGVLAALVLGSATAVPAQTRVEGGVVIQSGPVTGHVEVGSPSQIHREPVREVIVVRHVHRAHGRDHRWWRKHGYRAVRVYHDGSRYYGRRLERRGLRAVIVYERRGRYYLWDEHHRKDRHHHDNKDDDREDDDD